AHPTTFLPEPTPAVLRTGAETCARASVLKRDAATSIVSIAWVCRAGRNRSSSSERESLSPCAHLGHPAVHCALSSAAQCPGPCRQQQNPHGKERNSFCQTASAWSRHSGMDSLPGTPECNLEIPRRRRCMESCFPT